MPALTWDNVGDRVYESGLDRGVLYLPDGSAVVWNGLTEVLESFDSEVESVYFDGMKINDLVTIGDFSATLKAITYPEEFSELEGYGVLRNGMLLGNQAPKSFGLCYRTRVGDDASGAESHYKIHLLYNLIAIPSERTYASLSRDPSILEFEWELSAVPEEIPGFRPTAYICLDSRKFDPWLLEDLEAVLYGNIHESARLMPMPEFVRFINEWYRIKIVDNQDGTWSAISDRPGLITVLDEVEQLIQITQVNVLYLDDDMYEISDVGDYSEQQRIKITNNNDGTWTVEAVSDNLIVHHGDGTFTVMAAEVPYQSEFIFRITDTPL